MATTKMTRQWDRWAGTVEDIERATRLAIDVLSQGSRTEPPCQIEIAFPQRVTNAESPDALQTEIDIRDLALIRSIRINVGAKRGLRATIHVERDSPALTVEVVGENRTRVEGLTSQLEELLRRGNQRPGGKNAIGGLAILFCFSIVFIGISIWRTIDQTSGSSEITVDSPAELAALLLIVFGAFGSFYAVLWLLPDLELLRPGEPTRLRRFRLAVMAFVGSLIVSIVATVIYEAVT
jgi:hypothetical protein